MKTEFRWLDLADRPALNTSRVATIRAKYDARGHDVSREFFDARNNPCFHSDGIAQHTVAFGSGDVLKESNWFDIRGARMVHPKEKYSRLLVEVDAWGNAIRQEYRGADDKPMNGPSGYARAEKDVDEFQRVVDERRFNAAGEPIPFGLFLKEVYPNSPAEALGLKAGDRITHYANLPISFQQIMMSRRSEELATDPPKELRFTRNGQPQLSVMVKPGRLGVVLEDRILPPKK